MTDLLARLGRALNQQLFEVSGTMVTVATALTSLLIVLSSVLVSRLARRTARRVLSRRGLAAEGSAASLLNLLHYLILATGLAVALQTLGIELGALFTAGAVFAVGLGFAMQNIAQNFVAGIILAVEQSIRVGDVLEVEGTVVRVEQIGIRSTVVRSRDGEDLIVPNATLIQSTVRNFTLQDSTYRLQTSVGVAYGSDMVAVRETLESVAANLTWRLPEPPPLILLREFGSSSVNYDVAVWIEDPWRARRLRSTLNESIWWALKDAGITIAFPQLDVHFRPQEVGPQSGKRDLA